MSGDGLGFAVKLEEAIEQFQIQTELFELRCEQWGKAVYNQLHSAQVTKDIHNCKGSPCELLTDLIETEFQFEDNLPFPRPKEFSWKPYSSVFVDQFEKSCSLFGLIELQPSVIREHVLAL